MSTENTAPEVQQTVVDTAPEQSQQTSQESTPEAKPEVKAEAPKSEIPAKFLKADGTPDYDKMAKSYTALEKKIGAKGNIAASSVDEYEWTPPENAYQLDPEKSAEFKKLALENGFTSKQYEFIMNSHNNLMTSMLDTVGLNPDKTEAALKEAWGKDFPEQMKSARAGFDAFAPSSANPNDPVWNHPEVMKLLARLGSEIGEDSVSAKPSAAASTRMTEAEVKAIMSSKEYRSGDRALHAQVTEWYRTK